MNDKKHAVFTNDKEFLQGVQVYELCADRHDDGKYLDFYDCSSCSGLDACREAFDDAQDKQLDKKFNERASQKLKAKNKTLHKQLSLV